MTTKALIIPAAGSGKRMKRKIPKPFLQLSGRTILQHTLERFLALKGLFQIIVATSEKYLDETRSILGGLTDNINPAAISGGKERQDSIYNALSQVMDVDQIIIHDAVRPFVELHHIEACCKAASETGAAVLGVPVKDTLKQVNDELLIQKTVDRAILWKAQTPQVFEKSLIIEAYEKARQENFVGTDDASLAERLGRKVTMVEGSASNFKITYPADLEMAKMLIEGEQKI